MMESYIHAPAVPKTTLLSHPPPTYPQSSWFRGVSDAMTTDSQEVMNRVKNLVSGSGANHKKNYNRQQADYKPQEETTARATNSVVAKLTVLGHEASTTGRLSTPGCPTENQWNMIKPLEHLEWQIQNLQNTILSYKGVPERFF